MCATLLQSCLTLCDPMNCNLPVSSVHGIFFRQYWSGLLFISPGDLSDPEFKPASLMSHTLVGMFFTTCTPW